MAHKQEEQRREDTEVLCEGLGVAEALARVRQSCREQDLLLEPTRPAAAAADDAGLDEEGGDDDDDNDDDEDAGERGPRPLAGGPSTKRHRGADALLPSAGPCEWQVELSALLLPGAPPPPEGRVPFTARLRIEPVGDGPAGCRVHVRVVGGDRKSFWRFSDVLRADVLRNGRRWRRRLAKEAPGAEAATSLA